MSRARRNGGSNECFEPRPRAETSCRMVRKYFPDDFVQQVALVPVFLHFWTGETLAAWLVIYAGGNLFLVADSGLQFRAIKRFLAFKSSVDVRTAGFYAAMLRIYLGL